MLGFWCGGIVNSFKLREYQISVLDQLNSALKTDKEVVIASAPNSGKTLMATEFMKQNPNSTFLILTHGTNVLKKQWEEKLAQSGLEGSTELGKTRITYGIPQNLHKKSGQKIDFLIVDEAHEFTEASMVTKIVKEFKPTKIIYLTGTPSKFIAKGHKLIVVPGIDLIKEGHSTDLYVGMFATKADIKDDDFNNEGLVKANKTGKLVRSARNDLDSLLTAMHKRLCETDMYKDKPNFRKLAEWLPTMGNLGKTLIACWSIKQAAEVQRYFDSKEIKALTSHYKNDKDSDNILKFKEDDETKILIVVDRAVLGFDMANLVNVVDMTCGKNVNLIYQLYSRVLRKGPNNEKKYFFKLSTEEMMWVSKLYMNAALLMLFEDFISVYNGKNLNEMKVLVKKTEESKLGTKSNKSKIKTNSGQEIVIDKLFMDIVTAGAMLIDIKHQTGQIASEYAYTQLGKAIEKSGGPVFNRFIKMITQENLDFLDKYGVEDERVYE